MYVVFGPPESTSALSLYCPLARWRGFAHPPRLSSKAHPQRAASRNGRPQLSRAVAVPHDARPLPVGAAHLLLIRVPALSQLSPSRSLPSSSAGWQRDNIVVSLRFEYTDAEYNVANSSMLAAIILTFICLAVQVRKMAPRRLPPPARPPSRPLYSARRLLSRPLASSAASRCSTSGWACCVSRRPATAAHALASPLAVTTAPLAGADCCCHITASILLSFIVIQKWHYVTTWYVFGFFR